MRPCTETIYQGVYAGTFGVAATARLDNLDQTHVDHVAAIINGQRRRKLCYHSPVELYHALTVH